MKDCGTRVVNSGPFAPGNLKGPKVVIHLLWKDCRYFLCVFISLRKHN